jgi:hypothetical protein
MLPWVGPGVSLMRAPAAGTMLIADIDSKESLMWALPVLDAKEKR